MKQYGVTFSDNVEVDTKVNYMPILLKVTKEAATEVTAYKDEKYINLKLSCFLPIT